MSTTMPNTESIGELWSVNTDALPYRWSPRIPEPNPELHPEFGAH
jgi:hypothetical protein